MEAKARNLKEEDYWGGFVIYEMKIQVHYETGRFLKILYYKEGKSQITVVMVFYYTLGKMHFELQDS